MRGVASNLWGELSKNTAKSILKTSIVFNSLGFIPQTPSLALIPLLTARLLQPHQGHCPHCAGRAGLHPSSQETLGGAPRPWGGVGMWLGQGKLALEKKSIKSLPQAEIHLKPSSKPPRLPTVWGPGAGRFACRRGLCRSRPECSRRYLEQQGTVLSCSLVCSPEPPTRHAGGLSRALMLQTPPVSSPESWGCCYGNGVFTS